MDIISIITMVIFLLPGIVGVLKRRKYGFIYALICVVLIAILIPGFAVLMQWFGKKFENMETFAINVLRVTKYNKLMMDEVVIPFFEPFLGGATAYFLYFSALGIYIVLSVLSSIFKRKKKNKEKE